MKLLMPCPDNQPAENRSFVWSLLGDGVPLLLLTALALAGSGGFAMFLSVTGAFLPHDVAFLGMQPADLCRINECRIVHFMIHDRFSFGGVLVSIAALYAWLALFPLREGEAWAWRLLMLSGVFGFGSFLAYIGYGYLDSWHGVATMLLLPVFIGGLWMTRKLVRHWPPWEEMLKPMWRPSCWRSQEGLSRLCLLATALGMIGAGLTITVIGMTCVFVPEDTAFIGLTSSELQAINPRLVPLIAHDRAGFGGGLLTTGLLVLGILWQAKPSRHVWEALMIAGMTGFGCAIGVHYPIGYVDWFHLAPAWSGLALFVAGMGLGGRRFFFGSRLANG